MSKKSKLPVNILFMLCVFTFFIGSSTNANAAKKPSLSTKSATIFVNGTYNIQVKNQKANSTCFYTSNKTKIAKVNSKGKITGMSKGNAQIKVRYKLKKKFYTIGTFKIKVKKSTIKTSYKNNDMYTGETLAASKYLSKINSSATYLITSSDSDVATGNTKGTITAHRAGKASLSIHEVYNKKSRTIGSIVVNISGSSLKTNSVKMPYNSTLNITELLNDVDETSIYTFKSNNTDLISINDNIIFSAQSGVGTQSCKITISEFMAEDSNAHNIGTLTVSVVDSAYISEADQIVYIGIGNTLEIGGEDNINISNTNSDATYTIIPSETTIISSDLVAKKYGETTVSIQETINGTTTTLPDTVTVIVARASIKDELLNNGLTTTVNGDTYSQYPVKCRNRNYTYSYTTSDKSVCEVKTAGTQADEDYLVLTPNNIGNAIITVYETTSSSSTKRTKLGSFGVTVNEDTSTITDIDELNASDIISNISVVSNGKTYNGNISDESLECLFSDEDDNGYIDYGTDLDNITSNDFNITFKKSKYTIQNIESYDSSSWVFTIGLGQPADEDSDEDEEATVDIEVALKVAEFDTASIIKSIKVKLGSASKTITSTTKFFSDDSTLQFDEGNKDFEAFFTASQFIAAGATEYNDDVEDPVSLSEIKNVSCTITGNTFNSKSNPNGNAAVTQISTATSDDNAEWIFTITFEDGTTEDCTVTLDLLDD